MEMAFLENELMMSNISSFLIGPTSDMSGIQNLTSKLTALFANVSTVTEGFGSRMIF
jgi:hypothetical protein